MAEDEEAHDSQGRLVDDAAVEDALAQVRGRGGPPLSASEESPLLRVRLSRDLDEAVRRAAERSVACCSCSSSRSPGSG